MEVKHTITPFHISSTLLFIILITKGENEDSEGGIVQRVIVTLEQYTEF